MVWFTIVAVALVWITLAAAIVPVRPKHVGTHRLPRAPVDEEDDDGLTITGWN